MKTLNKITDEDLQIIFNSSYRKREKVTQFGQTIDNPNLTNVNDPAFIDTLDVLRDLFDESLTCYDMTGYDMHDLQGTDFEWIQDLEEVDHVNTYNWSAPLTNDLDIKIYKDNEKMYFLTSVQNGYSDARCGYMVEFLFILDINYSSEDWAVLLSELPSSYKSFTTSNDYTFDLDIFKESGVFNISKNDGTYDDYDVYVGDYNDCEKYANKIEEEEKEEA